MGNRGCVGMANCHKSGTDGGCYHNNKGHAWMHLDFDRGGKICCDFHREIRNPKSEKFFSFCCRTGSKREML